MVQATYPVGRGEEVTIEMGNLTPDERMELRNWKRLGATRLRELSRLTLGQAAVRQSINNNNNNNNIYDDMPDLVSTDDEQPPPNLPRPPPPPPRPPVMPARRQRRPRTKRQAGQPPRRSRMIPCERATVLGYNVETGPRGGRFWFQIAKTSRKKYKRYCQGR